MGPVQLVRALQAVLGARMGRKGKEVQGTEASEEGVEGHPGESWRQPDLEQGSQNGKLLTPVPHGGGALRQSRLEPAWMEGRHGRTPDKCAPSRLGQ